VLRPQRIQGIHCCAKNVSASFVVQFASEAMISTAKEHGNSVPTLGFTEADGPALQRRDMGACNLGHEVCDQGTSRQSGPRSDAVSLKVVEWGQPE
jgi:hypothetical protein